MNEIEEHGNACASARWRGWREVADNQHIKRDYPVIAQSLALAASPQIRNMATVSAAMFCSARAANISARLAGPQCNKRERRLRLRGAARRQSQTCGARRQRPMHRDLSRRLRAGADRAARDGAFERRAAASATLPFEQLHLAPRSRRSETILGPGEMITGFSLARARGRGVRSTSRFATASPMSSRSQAPPWRSISTETSCGTRISDLGGVAYRPWRAAEAENALRGRKLDEESARKAAEIAYADAVTHGQNDYKPELGRARSCAPCLLRKRWRFEAWPDKA